MVLTAALACEEVLGSEADWHPEIRTRTPRSGSESNRFIMKRIQGYPQLGQLDFCIVSRAGIDHRIPGLYGQT